MRTQIIIALFAAGLAQAGTVIDIDATKYGCSQCNGPTNVEPGTTVNPFFTGGASSLLQLTLGPGTYTITNADPNGTDYFSAWNFQGYPTSGNWVWSFMVADDATDKILMDDFVTAIEPTQSAMSNLTGTMTFDGMTQLAGTSTAGFTDTLTLASTKTLDFFIDDFALGDNGGGVALNISGQSAAPEPGTAGLLLGALAALGIWRIRYCKSALTATGTSNNESSSGS